LIYSALCFLFYKIKADFCMSSKLTFKKLGGAKLDSLPKGVCVKVDSLRESSPRYDNLEEWCANPANELVCRGGRVFVTDQSSRSKHVFSYRGSPWANPFKLSEFSLEESLAKYEEHLEKLLEDPKMLALFLLLREKSELGCFCGSKDRCHRDVILFFLKKRLTASSGLS